MVKTRAGDVDAWVSFVGSVAREWGERFAALQITGEPNLIRGGTATSLMSQRHLSTA